MAFGIGTITSGDKWFSYLQLCDVNSPGTLIYFEGGYVYPTFPYANINRIKNSPSCTGIGQVCDIQYIGVPQIQAPTNQYSLDGRITVQASSSYGPVKYSLNDDQYKDMINTTGIFIGLAPGVYNIYARDTHNCLASVKVTVTTSPIYSLKYRLNYKDIVGLVVGEIRILERDYTGDSIDVDGGDPIIILRKPQTDLKNKFEALRPTFATIMLMSKNDYQFVSLFTQDDRKYKVQFLKNGILRWSGFITPSVFNENMALPSYPTQINVTDNIEDLSNIPFLDDSIFQGNSAIAELVGGNPFQGNFSLPQIVGLVLKKLNLDIHVRFAINMLEQTLNIHPYESYIDASTFFDYDQNTVWNCDKVLKTILEPFGAFLIQDDGVWNIVRLEEQCAPYDYKEYDLDANFIANGTNDKVIEIKDPSLRLGAVFLDTDQTVLEINPAYGIFDIKHNMIAKKSLLVDFDFNPFNFDGTNFKGWALDRTHCKTVKVSVQQTVNDNIANQLNNILNSDAFLVDFGSFSLTLENLDNPATPDGDPNFNGVNSAITGGGQFLTIISKQQAIQYSSDSIDFSFDYRFNTQGFFNHNEGVWLDIKFQIKLGNESLYYVQNPRNDSPDITLGNWRSTDVGLSGHISLEDTWNQIIVDQINTDGSFKVSGVTLPIRDNAEDTIQISFRIGGETRVDFFDLTASSSGTQSPFITILKTIPTVNLPLGTRRRGYGNHYFTQTVGRDGRTGIGNEANVFLGYTLTDGDNSSDYTEVRPNDYGLAGTPNNVYWKNDFIIRDFYLTLIDKFYLDNVIIKFNPLFSDAPVLEEIALLNNQNYRENLPVELNAGDLPEVEIDSSKYIYRNYFRDVDGNPTRDWNRVGIVEKNTMQKLLLKQLSKQYSSPTYKITGAFRGYNDLGFLTILKHIQPAPNVVLINPELNGVGIVTTGWGNVGAGSIQWNNSANEAVAILANADILSQILTQSVALDFSVNERFSIEFSCARSTSDSRIDELHICLLDDADNIIQDLTAAVFKNDSALIKKISFNCQQNCANIGFYIKNIIAGGNATYSMDYFRMTALTIVRYYSFNQVDIDDHANKYDSELLQLMPMITGADPTIDDSGDNTGSGSPSGGGGFSGAYSDGYGSGFNSVLS